MSDHPSDQDIIVVGSGPNALSAGITLARQGWNVTIYEAASTVGGGMRSAEITLPNHLHDICSAVHPLAASSPVFADMPLHDYGLEWIHPELPLAHPFDDGNAAILARSLEETSDSLGRDGPAWKRLMQPFAENWDDLVDDLLGPIRLPRHVGSTLRFGISGLRSAAGLATSRFAARRARALFAGLAGHIMMPLERSPTAAFGLMLGAAGHAVGWPFARGGSQTIADALAAYFRSLGGQIRTDYEVRNLDDLPAVAAVVLDLTPHQIVRIAGRHLPARYRHALNRYRYGCGVFKMDWALSEPVPWKAQACSRAGTVHLGPYLEDIASSERDAWEGRISPRPFVLLAQPSLFDSDRAPAGRHTLWAYCHVPNASEADRTDAIEQQIERFAPGFKDVIVSRHTMTAHEMEAYNPNYVGGDINGGTQDLGQLFTRPVARLDPYVIPVDGHFVCSSATPPGGGVHGLCGYFAAKSVIRYLRKGSD